LPFRDGQFDLITAFSVFTHIDALEIAWLLVPVVAITPPLSC
jgi:hypothetical protein